VIFPGRLDSIATAKAKAIAVPLFPAVDGSDYIERGYLHWSVEMWGWNEVGYYNWLVDKVNGAWTIIPSTPTRLNAVDYPLPDGYAAATYKRNSHAVSIAINALSSYPDGRGASPSDFGPQPLELEALELMCALAARLCLEYTIDPAGTMPGDNPHAGEPTFTTHAEAAIADGYYVTQAPTDGITRWDFARLAASPEPLSIVEAQATGARLRARIAAYYGVIA
jgi:hypothetical protein